MQLFSRELGEGKQELIILHGLFGSCDNWLTFSKLLSDRYKIYLLDQRNHGRSPWDNGFDYNLMADDLLEFITQHRLSNPIIIGHSMGGKAAMRFASKYPDMIKKLVVVDIGPKYYKPHHQRYLAALHALVLTQINNRVEAEEKISQFIPENDVKQFLLKNLYRTDEGAFAWRMNLEVITKNIDNIGEGLDANIKFRSPTLFVRGGKSDYITEDDLIMIKWMFPNSQVVTIPECGHWVQAEKPQQLSELLVEFIEKI